MPLVAGGGGGVSPRACHAFGRRRSLMRGLRVHLLSCMCPLLPSIEPEDSIQLRAARGGVTRQRASDFEP